jgi:ribose transport system substrate-binding protein
MIVIWVLGMDSSYTVESVMRAVAVLRAFRSPEECLRLRDVIERTHMEKTVAFRLLRTLESAGALRRVGKLRYAANVKWREEKAVRIGYAAQAENSYFSRAVTEGLRRAAERANIELVVVNNEYNARTAVKNAHALVEQKVQLAIEFQTHERVAAEIAGLFAGANIPLIAVDIPHPGAAFYGVNNYRVGLLAGRVLGRWARQAWSGEPDEVLLLALEAAGSLPQLRLTGAQAGVQEMLPGISPERFVQMDCRGEFDAALEAVTRHLRDRRGRRILVTGVNEPMVMGALRAFEEAGVSRQCAAVGLGAIGDARAELRRPGTRLLGCVGFFPEHYGDDLINLALDLLQGGPVPPAMYAPSHLITTENVSKFYPNDGSPQAVLRR